MSLKIGDLAIDLDNYNVNMSAITDNDLYINRENQLEL